MIKRSMSLIKVLTFFFLLKCTSAHQDEANCVAQDGVQYVDCVSKGGSSDGKSGGAEYLEPACCEYIDFDGTNGVMKVKAGSPILLELSSIDIPNGVDIFIKNVVCWQTEGCKVIVLDSSVPGKIFLSLNGPKFTISSHNKAASLKFRMINEHCQCDDLFVVSATTEIDYPDETETTPEFNEQLKKEARDIINGLEFLLVEFISVEVVVKPDNSLKVVVEYYLVKILAPGKRAAPNNMEMEIQKEVQRVAEERHKKK